MTPACACVAIPTMPYTTSTPPEVCIILANTLCVMSFLQVYDLHAAHQTAGATDMQTVTFVPPEWRPFNALVPQIPGTFPVRACPVTGAQQPNCVG